MKPLIVANWKMNPGIPKQAEDLLKAIKKGLKKAKSDIIICPPFVYLALPAFKGREFFLGAQNAFWEEKGAYTGEISGEMLKSSGVSYVIIGHSERRKYFSETDEIINKKIKESLKAGLKVIFCIGETEEERENGKKNEILEKQIKEGLREIKIDSENLIVAYEPVWAIGTGKNCSTEETKESAGFIRNLVSEGIKVIYGGSVTSENSALYVKEAKTDGLLVGGASLKAEEFLKIIKSVEE